MSYGQGYGDWQQYAGFGKTEKTFGGASGLGVQPDKNIPAATPDTGMPAPDTNLPPANYAVTPAQPSTGQLGANPANSLGIKPFGPLGAIPSSAQKAINSHYGVE
jgi:hypothetical protein